MQHTNEIIKDPRDRAEADAERTKGTTGYLVYHHRPGPQRERFELWVLVAGCQRETRGTDSQTWIVPWLHRLVLHTKSRLNFCETVTRTRTPLRPSLCRLWMRWTRLLSKILGTGTSTTCFQMLCGTRPRVITSVRFRVCDSLLIDGTFFRSVTSVTRIGSNCTCGYLDMVFPGICGGLVNVFLSPSSVAAS